MVKPKENNKRISFLSGLLLFFNVLAVIALLLSYLSMYISPDKFWPILFVGFAYPFILLVNFLFALYWLLRFRKWFWLSVIAIAIGFNQVPAHIKLFGKSNIPPESKQLKVMSFNTRFFDRFKWIYDENTRTRDEIFSMISDESPDIICFQEFYTDQTPEFNTVDFLVNSKGFPYYHAHYPMVKSRERSYGTATFSRFPIINKEVFRFTNNIYNFAIISDIVVKTDTFRVFNIHFESIRLSEEDKLFINELLQQPAGNDETMNKYKEIGRKIKAASILRASQSREIAQLVSQSPYPVIICADLNDTPSFYAYRQLARNLKDAFVESGRGIGNTYVGFLPAFRIDFIFHDPFFRSRNYRVVHQRLSDHYPITTTLIYE